MELDHAEASLAGHLANHLGTLVNEDSHAPHVCRYGAGDVCRLFGRDSAEAGRKEDHANRVRPALNCVNGVLRAGEPADLPERRLPVARHSTQRNSAPACRRLRPANFRHGRDSHGAQAEAGGSGLCPRGAPDGRAPAARPRAGQRGATLRRPGPASIADRASRRPKPRAPAAPPEAVIARFGYGLGGFRHHRSVARQSDPGPESREPIQRIQVFRHAAVRRIDHDGPPSGEHVPAQQGREPLLEEAQMALRMPGRVQHLDAQVGRPPQLDGLAAFEAALDSDPRAGKPLRCCGVRPDRHGVMAAHGVRARHMVYMVVRQPDGPQASSGPLGFRVDDLPQPQQLCRVGSAGIDQDQVPAAEQQGVRVRRRRQGPGRQGNDADSGTELDRGAARWVREPRIARGGPDPPGRSRRGLAALQAWAGPAAPPRRSSARGLPPVGSILRNSARRESRAAGAARPEATPAERTSRRSARARAEALPNGRHSGASKRPGPGFGRPARCRSPAGSTRQLLPGGVKLGIRGKRSREREDSSFLEQLAQSAGRLGPRTARNRGRRARRRFWPRSGTAASLSDRRPPGKAFHPPMNRRAFERTTQNTSHEPSGATLYGITPADTRGLAGACGNGPVGFAGLPSGGTSQRITQVRGSRSCSGPAPGRGQASAWWISSPPLMVGRSDRPL